MNEETRITGWWSFLGAVVLQPTWELVTTGAVFTVLTVGTWWRDNFASDEWKKRLELKGFLPHWHPAWWVCIGLVVLMLVVIRASHRLWIVEHKKVAELEGGPVPELVISLVEDERREPLGILLKNVSHTDNLHNVSIADSATTLGQLSWFPYTFPCIQSSGSEVQVEPFIEIELNGQKQLINSLKRVGDALKRMDSTDRIEKIQFLVMAQDARRIYYTFTTILRCNVTLNWWVVGPTKRERPRVLTDKEMRHTSRTLAWLKGISSRLGIRSRGERGNK